VDEDCNGQVCKNYSVRLVYSGDDQIQAYVDGTMLSPVASDNAWNVETSRTITLTSGTHTLGWYVWDSGRVAVGFAAAVQVDGTWTARSDDGTFIGTTSNPGASWPQPGFNAASWSPVRVCTYDPWSSAGIATLDAVGVRWGWADAGNCYYGVSANQAWFRKTLVLP
jgi:hypothetical protein